MYAKTISRKPDPKKRINGSSKLNFPEPLEYTVKYIPGIATRRAVIFSHENESELSKNIKNIAGITKESLVATLLIPAPMSCDILAIR